MAPLTEPRLSTSSIGPALFMVLPVIAIGALSLHALEVDTVLLRARRGDAALQTLRSVGETARGAVTQAVEDAARRTAAAAGRPEAVRSLVLGGTIALAAMYEDGRRTFPPEDPEALLVTERNALTTAAGALATARAALDGAPQGWAWVAEPDGGGVLNCRRAAGTGELCVLLDAASLRTALAGALAAARRSADGWALTLSDPAGRTVWSQGRSAAPPLSVLALDGALRGWHAEASPAKGAVPASAPAWAPDRTPAWALAAAMPALLGVWLLLAWRTQRRQQARLADSHHRAEIVAQLSHELRTPLANLRLYAGLIHRRAREAEAVRDFCSVIDAEADRLSRLADNAVALARGDAPENAVHVTAAPDAVVHDAVDRLRPLCDAAECLLVVHAPASPVRRFDGAAVEQILTNLIDNARKYAPGRPIEVTGRLERRAGRDWLFLAVRDHGPGVPPTQRERIFEPSVRGTVAGGVGGFGIGLATVRRLARASGGDARVEDARPGARFVAWVRLSPVEETPDRFEEIACAS